MTDKKELNEKQQDQVAGGSPRNDHYDDKYVKAYTIKVDKYDVYKYEGQNMFFIYKVTGNSGHIVIRTYWAYGTLIESFEKSESCGTVRTAKVNVVEGYNVGLGEHELSLDHYEAYIKG